MQPKIPPFYENWDNAHCAQCVLRGIVEHFEPDQIWTWEEWDRFTAKEPGKWTWPYRALVNMIERGYNVVYINSTSLQEYIDFGIYETMVKNLGVEVADKQREMADLDLVKTDLLKYWALIQQGVTKREQRHPTIDDMKKFLDEGYLIWATLNSRILNGLDGYSSHILLVYKVDDEFVYFHDPGTPPIPERKVPIELFLKASTSPTPSKWAITAYKKL